LKVALCTDWFYPRIGGIQSHVIGLTLELTKQGHEVVIITKEMNGKKSHHRGTEVEHLVRRVKPLVPLSHILIPPDLTELKDILKREKFDIVHAHHAFTPTSLMSVKFARKLGIPTILTNHSIFLANSSDHLWTPMSHFLFPFRHYINEAEKIIAVSKAAADFIEHFSRREKIVVIPNGVDVHRFTFVKSTVANGLPFSILKKPTILYVGRLVYRKGIHVLLRSMPYILEAIPDTQLLIAGSGYMESFIRLLTKSLNLEDHIRLLGFVPEDELPSLYNLSDLFILPSIYAESFGITLLEAMASGTPIVASAIGGIPEVVENGVNGILFKKGDELDLANAVIRVLDDPALANELAINARKKVEEQYSWPVVVKAIEGVYENVM